VAGLAKVRRFGFAENARQFCGAEHLVPGQYPQAEAQPHDAEGSTTGATRGTPRGASDGNRTRAISLGSGNRLMLARDKSATWQAQ